MKTLPHRRVTIVCFLFCTGILSSFSTADTFDEKQRYFRSQRRGTVQMPLEVFHWQQQQHLHLRDLRQEGSAKEFPDFARPDYSYYHTRQGLLDEVHEVVSRHRDIMSEEVLRLSLYDYATELSVITVTKSGVTPDPSTKIRVLLDFGQHGREPITSEVALRLLAALGGEVAVPLGVDRRALDRVLSSSIIKIVPMENVNGRAKVEEGQFCERKNGRGVDTNRNWSVDWGKKEKDYDPTEEYPGTGPFSEPEAEIIRSIASEFKPHLWVNVHSGMEALFMPYDHIKGVPEDGAAEPMRALLDMVNQLHCGQRCTVGSGGGSVGYLAHGTATDYMYQELQIPIAFTWEIYGDEKAHNDDCFRMFNPVTEPLFEEVVSNWTGAFLTLLANAPGALEKMPHRTTGDFGNWTLAGDRSMGGGGKGSIAARVGEEEGRERSGGGVLRGESGMERLRHARIKAERQQAGGRRVSPLDDSEGGGEGKMETIGDEENESYRGENVARAGLHGRRTGPLHRGVGSAGLELRAAMWLSFGMVLVFGSLLTSMRCRHHLPWWHWRLQKSAAPGTKEFSVRTL